MAEGHQEAEDEEQFSEIINQKEEYNTENPKVSEYSQNYQEDSQDMVESPDQQHGEEAVHSEESFGI